MAWSFALAAGFFLILEGPGLGEGSWPLIRPSGRAGSAGRARAGHTSTSFPSSPGGGSWRLLRLSRRRSRLCRAPRPASEPHCVDPAPFLPLMGQVGGPYVTTGSHRSRIRLREVEAGRGGDFDCLDGASPPPRPPPPAYQRGRALGWSLSRQVPDFEPVPAPAPVPPQMSGAQRRESRLCYVYGA